MSKVLYGTSLYPKPYLCKNLLHFTKLKVYYRQVTSAKMCIRQPQNAIPPEKQWKTNRNSHKQFVRPSDNSPRFKAAKWILNQEKGNFNMLLTFKEISVTMLAELMLRKSEYYDHIWQKLQPLQKGLEKSLNKRMTEVFTYPKVQTLGKGENLISRVTIL